jgi:hypothetical protein
MEKTLDSVKGNFNTIRTGRASPSLLDRVEVKLNPVFLLSMQWFLDEVLSSCIDFNEHYMRHRFVYILMQKSLETSD